MANAYKTRFLIIKLWINFQNLVLVVLAKIIFPRRSKNPQNIVVFKLGNIGDIICSIPALMTIKDNYPSSNITLLASPGDRGAPGAKDLLSKVAYIDNLLVYYSEDTQSFKGMLSLIKKVRALKPDLFIQLPDHWANFRTMFRNLVFAKLSKAKSAFGFYISRSEIFKKVQVKHGFSEQETDRLLNILRK